MTHTKKDCCERPRKIGAKFTGQDIMPDEIVMNLDLDYDAKRDRWNGFNPDDYDEVMQEFELYEEARKKRLLEKTDSKEEEDQNQKIEEKEKESNNENEEFPIP